MRYHEISRSKKTLCMPHLKIKPVSFDCGASRSTLSISFYQMMQPMQPRYVLQQAVPRQPVVLSHARPAQPWLGQLQQLPAQVRPAAGRMAPAAMPPPIVKDMAKPGARPLRWVYAAPMLRNRGCSTNPKVILPFSKVVPTKVIGPEQKELPKQAGVEEMPHRLKSFWEFSLFRFCQESKCEFVPVGFASRTESYRRCPCR